jgi:ribosome-associated translation inhibitor RaiA
MRIEARGVGYELDDDLKAYVERRLRASLGRFAARVERLTVLLSDVNGPRRGIDKRCRVAVALVPRGTVIVEGLGEDPFVVVADAARRVRRAVRKAIQRRRLRRAARAVPA